MKLKLPAIAVALFILVTGSVKGAKPVHFDFLNPGGRPSLEETVPVNVVFVGYEADQIDRGAFVSTLPRTYQPVVRSRLLYDLKETLGITYGFQYRVVFTDAAWENQFFQTLSGLATPAPATLFQTLYNDQQSNVLDVGHNYFIDAPTVEQWLASHAPAGVDTRRNTIFFINWWGRSDFVFHVYTKFGEADPDTGYDFGVNRQTRKIIAWGGTTPKDEESWLGGTDARRVWFHDLSAGPEAWTDNWNVDDADVDGDGSADYRLPPIWEYLLPGGYRAASALTGDLSMVARFVAINLLFTTSPLYPPYITPNRQPASINVDLNTYEGWRGVDASQQFQKQSLLVAELSELHRVPYTSDTQDLPFTTGARECYRRWLSDKPCFSSRPQYPPFANLFLFNALNIERLFDGGGQYEGPVLNYVTEDRLDAGFLGFADDNYIDGTQSLVFAFLSPSITQLGYGLTTTQIHEFGHHIGMSHPHDGYDSEIDVDYAPEGGTYFAWAGDESNSIMSYVDLNWDFSQFDQDNFNRAQTAGYMITGNAIAQDVLDSPRAEDGLPALQRADEEFGIATSRFADHDYVGAFDHARLGYNHVRAAASAAGVTVVASTSGWTALPPARGKALRRDYSYVDRYGPGTKRSAR